jgi:hypothetical protein
VIIVSGTYPATLPAHSMEGAEPNSIIGSCRRRAINPQEYLTAILGRLPTAKTPDLHGLLPANWKAPEINTS